VNRRCGVLFVATEGAFEIPLRLQSALEAKFPEIKSQLPFALARECPRLLDRSALPQLKTLAREAADRMRENYREGPFENPHARLPQHPTVARERAAAQQRYRQRRRKREGCSPTI
jgi:hypothetical protein